MYIQLIRPNQVLAIRVNDHRKSMAYPTIPARPLTTVGIGRVLLGQVLMTTTGH